MFLPKILKWMSEIALSFPTSTTQMSFLMDIIVTLRHGKVFGGFFFSAEKHKNMIKIYSVIKIKL